AAAAIALHRIGGIGHQLQFAQHELRNHQHSVEETGVGDIGDAAVNYDAGVEDLERLLRALLSAEYAPERGQVQEIALARPDYQADVSHPQQDADLDEVNRSGTVGSGAADHQRHQKRAEDSRDGSGGPADQPSQ